MDGVSLPSRRVGVFPSEEESTEISELSLLFVGAGAAMTEAMGTERVMMNEDSEIHDGDLLDTVRRVCIWFRLGGG